MNNKNIDSQLEYVLL